MPNSATPLQAATAACVAEYHWEPKDEAEHISRTVLDAVPDGWVKVDGQWMKLPDTVALPKAVWDALTARAEGT